MMRPLNQHMAKKLMLFVSLMTSATSNLLMGLQLDGRDGLREISGAPHSWLSQSAVHQGLQARSINYQTGYDLYKEETWHHLRQLQQKGATTSPLDIFAVCEMVSLEGRRPA